MRVLAGILAILFFVGCGDEYYTVNNPSELGAGPAGQYFLVIKNFGNTCPSAMKDYHYPALIEYGKPVKEALSNFIVTPLDAEEKEFNFKFLGYAMNGIDTAEDGSFELYLKDSYDADIYFMGRFFENRVTLKFEINVSLKGFVPCQYVFEGLAEKYLDYVIPEVSESAYTK